MMDVDRKKIAVDRPLPSVDDLADQDYVFRQACGQRWLEKRRDLIRSVRINNP
ncbi:MAG: hypothetical protein ACQERN_12055 [Thermodesulfobacteriota bacterium]